MPSSLAFVYERYAHLYKWFRYAIRGGIGLNVDFGLYTLAGNSLIIDGKVNCEIGLNYTYNYLPTGFLVPGGSLESGLQTIIGIRIQNLKIPITFHIFYEIPYGNAEYLTGCGV